MPRKSKIKWREVDLQTLSRTVRNFNAKIRRILKKDEEAVSYLPKTVTIKELKAKIKTRQDFNREIKSLQRFSKKGAEKMYVNPQGVGMTVWEKIEAAIKVGVLNRRKAKEKKKRKIEIPKNRMGTPLENSVRPIKNKADTAKGLNDWEAFKKALDAEIKSTYTEEKLEDLIRNYISAVWKVFGSAGADIVFYVKSMQPDKFLDMYYDCPEIEFEYIYGPEDQTAIHDGIVGVMEDWMENNSIDIPDLPDDVKIQLAETWVKEAEKEYTEQEAARKTKNDKYYERQRKRAGDAKV